VPAPSSTRYAHPPIIFSSCRDEERETASTRSHREEKIDQLRSVGAASTARALVGQVSKLRRATACPLAPPPRPLLSIVGGGFVMRDFFFIFFLLLAVSRNLGISGLLSISASRFWLVLGVERAIVASGSDDSRMASFSSRNLAAPWGLTPLLLFVGLAAAPICSVSGEFDPCCASRSHPRMLLCCLECSTVSRVNAATGIVGV